MFNKIQDSFDYIYNTAESVSDILSEIGSLTKQISKVEKRYYRYEAALKDIAEDTCNDIYALRRLAKEILVSDEEIQIKQLKEILVYFDKEVIIKVLKDYR